MMRSSSAGIINDEQWRLLWHDETAPALKSQDMVPSNIFQNGPFLSENIQVLSLRFIFSETCHYNLRKSEGLSFV